MLRAACKLSLGSLISPKDYISVKAATHRGLGGVREPMIFENFADELPIHLVDGLCAQGPKLKSNRLWQDLTDSSQDIPCIFQDKKPHPKP